MGIPWRSSSLMLWINFNDNIFRLIPGWILELALKHVAFFYREVSLLVCFRTVAPLTLSHFIMNPVWDINVDLLGLSISLPAFDSILFNLVYRAFKLGFVICNRVDYRVVWLGFLDWIEMTIRHILWSNAVEQPLINIWSHVNPHYQPAWILVKCFILVIRFGDEDSSDFASKFVSFNFRW